MQKKIIFTGIVSLLVVGAALATRNTDVIYVVVSLAFFGLCIAYAEWCERL